MQVYLDNIVFSIQKAGGVSVYWYELLQGIFNSGLSVNLLNAQRASANIFERRLDYSRFECLRESRLPFKYLRYMPIRCRLPAASIFHGGYLRVSPQKNILNILTVHDLAHERKLATRFPRGLTNIIQKAYGIRRADGIICISESTRQELLHFYPFVNPEKVKVVYHGIANDFYPLNKSIPPFFTLPFNLRQPYILYVGARRNYKNFGVAVKALKQLPEAYKLVIVGGEQWSREEIIALQEIAGRYHIFENVSAADLNVLYNYAFCLLYTSIYEGFGFPPGEALKAGCPVVTTNRTSMPEVVGAAGLLVDQPDPLAFAEKITSLENQPYRQRLTRVGLQQVQKFTWEKSVQETISFYKDCWNYKFSK